MDTSYPQKFAALTRAVLSSPAQVPSWIAHWPLWKRYPSDLELPWWSYGAIDHLDRFLRKDHAVFEFGSGGSSFFAARRAHGVLSVENDPVWHELVTAKARQQGLTSLECELHPLADDSLDTFLQSSFHHRIESGTWDVVIVDCHLGFQAGRYGVIRPAAFAAALPRVKPQGVIVLDDSWMFPELLVPRPGWKIRNFVGLGPCRYGVTSTAILQRTG